MSAIFVNGNTLIVYTRGPGNLHLLTYGGNLSKCNGAIPTTNKGVSRYLISFSHNYTKYAFYWDGAGEAVYSIGTHLQRLPVGTSWTKASTVSWGASTVVTADVTSDLAGALPRNGETTAYVIPEEDTCC
jgi:hypothetical protein